MGAETFKKRQTMSTYSYRPKPMMNITGNNYALMLFIQTQLKY